MATHKIHGMRSDELLYRIHRAGRKVRFWFNAYGSLVGCWKSRDGRTFAVGHDRWGHVIIYTASAPADHWRN